MCAIEAGNAGDVFKFWSMMSGSGNTSSSPAWALRLHEPERRARELSFGELSLLQVSVGSVHASGLFSLAEAYRFFGCAKKGRRVGW